RPGCGVGGRRGRRVARGAWRQRRADSVCRLRAMSFRTIAPAAGRLGVLTPGLGAVASTFMAGVLSARSQGAAPIGSLTQMARIRLGGRDESRNPLIKDFVPLASLDDIVFGAWDPISANALEAARTAGVLEDRDLAPIS